MSARQNQLFDSMVALVENLTMWDGCSSTMQPDSRVSGGPILRLKDWIQGRNIDKYTLTFIMNPKTCRKG